MGRWLELGIALAATGLVVLAACGNDTKVVQEAPPPATGDAGTGATPPATDDDDETDAASEASEESGYPDKWSDGTKCSDEPELQTWQHAPGVFILRQSICTSFEAPFMYLIVGETKAMLVDTGDDDPDHPIKIRPKVRELLGDKDVELVIAHSHSHGDHVGHDSEFRGKSKTTLVGYAAKDVYAFFGIADVMSAGMIDLGNRMIDVLPIPGHEAAHVAYFDRTSKVLLTGDTLYPGRLYVDDWAAYQKSVPRLRGFVEDGHEPSAILGGHVELRAKPKDDMPDFPFQAKSHPDEHTLQLTTADLKELESVVLKEASDHGDAPENVTGKNFIFDPNPGL